MFILLPSTVQTKKTQKCMLKKLLEGFGYAAIAASIEIVTFEEGHDFLGQDPK